MTHPTSTPVAVDLESKAALRAGINSLLPPELLALAFSFLVTDAVDAISFKSPGGPDATEVQRRFSQHPLWNPSLVCRAWHAIVKGTPRFWTFVAIGVTPPAEQSVDASDSHSAMATSSQREERSKRIEILLNRSGRLPLTIVMCPQNIQDFDSVSYAIHKHFDRLETLSLITSAQHGRIGRRPWPFRTTLHQGLGLLAAPMPKLKLLSVAKCLKPFMYGIAGRSMSIQKEVNAPELETLSCHTHLIVPESPTRLLSLSLINVDIDQFGRRAVELPHVVDLRIEDCSPGIILSTLLTPSLRRLVVKKWTISNDSVQLPRFDSLQELQWLDTGEDPVFVTLSRLCPNLNRYLNYIEEDNLEKDIKMNEKPFPRAFDPTPMILGVFDEDGLGGVNAHNNWPVLEEVSLKSTSCDHVATLIEAIPSIKRVRILRDPVLLCNEDDREGEMGKFTMLRRKVEVAIRGEPWGSGFLGNETPREGAVTV